MRPAIPTLDIAPFLTGTAEDRSRVAEALDRICVEIGFLVVTGHGVDAALVERVFAANRAFFDLPLAEKSRYAPTNGFYRGYVALGDQALSYSLDEPSPPDLYERFSIGQVAVPDDAYHRARATDAFAPNTWPERPADYRPAMTEYYQRMERLAADLMEIFALALNLPPGFFTDKIDRHITSLTVNHYPAPTVPPLPGQLRAGAHSDYGSLTILAATDAPGGLQVRDRTGAWRDVAPVEGGFIVNIGDLMAQWTNDRWISTVHRVVNPPPERAAESRRLSIAFFHQPNDDALIECLPSCLKPGEVAKYPPVTSGEHLRTKLGKQVRQNAAL